MSLSLSLLILFIYKIQLRRASCELERPFLYQGNLSKIILVMVLKMNIKWKCVLYLWLFYDYAMVHGMGLSPPTVQSYPCGFNLHNLYYYNVMEKRWSSIVILYQYLVFFLDQKHNMYNTFKRHILSRKNHKKIQFSI